MKEIVSYKTNDGKIFEDKIEAAMHEYQEEVHEIMSDTFDGSIDSNFYGNTNNVHILNKLIRMGILAKAMLEKTVLDDEIQLRQKINISTVRKHIREGHLLEAVKYVKCITDWGLKESKAYCDGVKLSMKLNIETQ